MQWNKHLDLEGQHAFLSASKYHWIRYSKDHLAETFDTYKATERGTILHDFAKRCIELKQELKQNGKTLNMYVNDAIAYNMSPEVVLYYSKYCFGTADAIAFRRKKLRIHDLKSGVVKAHMDQLYVYAALFCLEYKIDPKSINTELRIYQSGEVRVENADPEYIKEIMDTIVEFDLFLNELEEERDI